MRLSPSPAAASSVASYHYIAIHFYLPEPIVEKTHCNDNVAYGFQILFFSLSFACRSCYYLADAAEGDEGGKSTVFTLFIRFSRHFLSSSLYLLRSIASNCTPFIPPVFVLVLFYFDRRQE